MMRGLRTTSCRMALAAAAGLLLGAALSPVHAADLGKGCCADLEERVAELEATTARKGNRTVSLTIYGQVNKGLLIWDDGIDSDMFVVDNTLSSSRFGFRGTAKIKPGWTAGYNMEFEVIDARSDSVENVDTAGVRIKNGDDTTPSAAIGDGTLLVRHNNLYVESDRLGRLTIGQGSTAADGANEVVISNSIRHSDINIGSGFRVRRADGTGSDKLGAQSSAPATVWAGNLDAGRNDVIRYDSPSIYGFILSSSWGDNDYADVALRFKKEFNSIRFAAALAYQWDNQYGLTNGINNDHETLGGSVSVMHVPTGLYAAFQAATRDYKAGSDLSHTRSDASFWYLQAGVERKFVPYGTTTVYGEYGRYDDFRAFVAGPVVGSEATRWGIGLNQKIDSAAMDVYAHATFWSFEDNTPVAYKDLSTIMVGSRIQF